MLAVVFAVKSADEPFKGFFVGELLFQLCMMLQTLVIIFNQVGCIDRRTDALREFVKSEQAVMELEYLLQSRIFAAESLQKGFQCLEDAAVASTYILLAAEEIGIGACWIHMRNRQGIRRTADEEIRKLLGVPDNFSVLNVVALGQKGQEKAPRTEKDVYWGNVHMETYGNGVD